MNRDPGLQPERTALAWRRTALAAAVVAALVIRLALLWGMASGPVIALGVLGWVAVVGLVYRRAAAITRVPSAGPSRAIPLLAALAVGYAGLGTALVLTSLR